ncbi:MAG TPA: hypothetical protein VF791_04895 [Pyrinomonadaceae bacterium]
MAWTFHLNINNQSGRELTTDAGNYDLKWGFWYRNNRDNQTPVSVDAGKNIQALGIRAARGTWTGYQFTCTWRDTTIGPGNFGTIALHIDVPYSGSNRSDLAVNGLYQQDGWERLPSGGSSFVRSITITVIEGELVAVDSDLPDLKDLEEIEDSYNQYQLLLAQNHELLENWPELERTIKEGPIIPINSMPNQAFYPPERFILGRSAPTTIPKKQWAGLADPRYQSLYSKNMFVEEYFSAAVYSINTNPRNWEPIPAGTAKKTVKSTSVTSSIKTVLETNFSIKVSLEAKSGNPKLGKAIAAKLESAYSQKNVLEKSTTRVDSETVEVNVPAVDFNRLFVPWVFSTAVMIYRKTKKGDYGLVAVSEWADLQLYKTYKH